MVEATKKLNEKIDETMNYVIQQLVSSAEDVMNMKTEDITATKMSIGVIKELETVMMKQATIIESQNVKIDELLRLVKTLTQK